MSGTEPAVLRLRGCRFPDNRPSLRGATLGWSHLHGKAHLYRSVLEGLCLELRRAADAMPVGSDGDQTVYVGGGGAQSDLLLSILADALNRPVEAAAEAGGESVALGAALLAARGAGVLHDFAPVASVAAGQDARVFQPDAGRAAQYEQLYRRVYCPLLEAATPLSAELSAICNPGLA